MLLIRFKLKHLISVDFILLTMTFQSKHTLHNSQIFSCLLPMAATDINTTRFHLDPVHLHQTGILIRQTWGEDKRISGCYGGCAYSGMSW